VLDGVIGRLGSLVVDETVTTGVSVLILSNFARKDVSEGGERIVKSLVVDGCIEVLDEDVSLTGLAEGGVTLRPHDAAWSTLDESVVELFQSTLSISNVIVVNIGVSERATSDRITANTNGGDLSNGGEELEEHSLSDGWVQFSDVEGGRVVWVGVGVGWRVGSSLSILLGILYAIGAGINGRGLGLDWSNGLLGWSGGGGFGRHFRIWYVFFIKRREACEKSFKV